MKFTKNTSAALVASMLATSAMAAEGDYYASAAAGYNVMNASGLKFSDSEGNSLKLKGSLGGFTGNLGLGYYYTDAIRADVTFGFTPTTSAKIEGSSAKIKLTSYTGLANVYYDFTGMAVVPYVTAGLGVISQSAKLTDGATSVKFKRNTGFAYQAGLGLGYEVTSGVMLDVGYRYNGSSVKMKHKDSDGKLTAKGAHSVLAGLRFSF